MATCLPGRRAAAVPSAGGGSVSRAVSPAAPSLTLRGGRRRPAPASAAGYAADALPGLRWRAFHTSPPRRDGRPATVHHVLPPSESESDRGPSMETDPSTVKRHFRRRLDGARAESVLGGGPARIDRQHGRGSLTARERLDLLFDGGTFREVDALVSHRCRDFGMDGNVVPGDGVVVGHGLVGGRRVYAFAQDFTVYGEFGNPVRGSYC